MTDESLTQRGTVRKVKKPLSEQKADARVRAETRANNRRRAFDAVLKIAADVRARDEADNS